MQLKEDIYGVSGRRRSRRAIDDDESDEGADDYDSEGEGSSEIMHRRTAGTKRTRAMEAQTRPRKRQRIDEGMSEEEDDVMQFDENGEVEEQKTTVVQDITLNGQIIILYSRDDDEPECISNFGIILKGEWNMGIKDK